MEFRGKVCAIDEKGGYFYACLKDGKREETRRYLILFESDSLGEWIEEENCDATIMTKRGELWKIVQGGYGPAVEPLYLCETPRGVKSGKPMALYLARGFAAGTLAAEPAPAFDRTEMLMSHYNELATRIGETAGEIREMFRETGLPYETTIGCCEEAYAVILLLLLTRELGSGLADETLRTFRAAGLLPPLLADERLKELTDARIGAPDLHDVLEAIKTYTNDRDDLEMYMKEIRQLPEGETLVSRLLPVSVLGNGTWMDMEVFHRKMKMLEEQSSGE